MNKALDSDVRIDILFGQVEIVSTRRWEGHKLLLGGYAIHYDSDGKETHRTPDTINVICEMPSGKEGRKLRTWIEAVWPLP